MFDIETNFDCIDFPVTSCSTTEIFNNKKTPNKFLKPIPSRKISKFRESEKDDLQIQKDFNFLQQLMPKEDSTHIFGKYVSQILESI